MSNITALHPANLYAALLKANVTDEQRSEFAEICEGLYKLSALWHETSGSDGWVDLHDWIGSEMTGKIERLYKLFHGEDFEIMTTPREVIRKKKVV